jgi:hypothetical protein
MTNNAEREGFSEARQQETLNIIDHGINLTSDPRYAQIVGLSLNYTDLLIIKAWQARAQASGVPDGWTDRHTRVQRFALSCLITESNYRAHAAGQDKEGVFFSIGAVDRYLADAKTAEECLAMLSAAPTPPKSASVPVERLEALVVEFQSKSYTFAAYNYCADDLYKLIVEYK